jgi:hypothetical protein
MTIQRFLSPCFHALNSFTSHELTVKQTISAAFICVRSFRNINLTEGTYYEPLITKDYPRIPVVYTRM